MNKWIILTCMLSWAVLSSAKPNVVIILADDLGWNAIGYHNPEMKTPNINRMCREGIELDQFYVSPMCSPTRAGVMTGRYPIRFGMARSVIPPYRDYGLPLTETTIAEALAKAGYENRGIFGKWHLGHLQAKWHPNERGFTEFVGCYNGAINYFTFDRDGEVDWHHNKQTVHETGYSTTAIGDAAVDFIKKSAKGKSPFLCYVPFNAPHGPLMAPESYLEQYRQVKDKEKRTYFAAITAMDDQVGRILDTIKAAGIDKETVVWFFSDNGGVGGIKDNNAPLHGSKLTTFDGGVRAAACVRFPGTYLSGQKITEPMAFIDVLPTVLSLANASPAAVGCKPLDGVDLNPLLAGKVKSLPERDLYFYHGQQGEDSEHMAIRSKQWKLVVTGPELVKGLSAKNEVELYNIEKDPNETKDLSGANPEVVDRLVKKLVEFRKLQPTDAIPSYKEGSKGFVPPKDWIITK